MDDQQSTLKHLYARQNHELEKHLLGLAEKKDKLSELIKNDSITIDDYKSQIEKLMRDIDDKKRQRSKIDDLMKEGKASYGKIVEASKHVLLHLKRESESL